MTEIDPKGALAAILEQRRAKQAEVDAIDEAIAEATPKNPLANVVGAFPDLALPPEPMRPGVRTSEYWLAIALPVIVGAVVQLGWLSEQAATDLGMVGGGAYIAGRSITKAIAEWVKR